MFGFSKSQQIAFVLMVVLMFRPTGFFGRRHLSME